MAERTAERRLAFTDRQYDRLDRAARDLDRTASSLAREIIEKWLDERDERRAEAKKRNGEDRNRRSQNLPNPFTDNPFVQTEDRAVARDITSPTVVINNGNGPGNGSSISAMARYVVSGGAEWRRDERLREVVAILKAAPAEDHRAMAESLDEAIKVLDRQKKESKAAGGFFDWMKR